MPDEPEDDDAAWRWDGDELASRRPTRPVRTAPEPAAEAAADEPRPASGPGVVAIAFFGAVALLEAIAWAQGVYTGPVAGTASPGAGTPGEWAGFALTLAFRGLAVMGPVLWLVLALRRIRPTRRLPWLVLGAMLFVPWPTLVRLL